jgi:hypothetical protein
MDWAMQLGDWGGGGELLQFIAKLPAFIRSELFM